MPPLRSGLKSGVAQARGGGSFATPPTPLARCVTLIAARRFTLRGGAGAADAGAYAQVTLMISRYALPPIYRYRAAHAAIAVMFGAGRAH